MCKEAGKLNLAWRVNEGLCGNVIFKLRLEEWIRNQGKNVPELCCPREFSVMMKTFRIMPSNLMVTAHVAAEQLNYVQCD